MHEYAMIELALLKEKLAGLLLELLTSNLQNYGFLDVVVNPFRRSIFEVEFLFFFYSI